MGATDTDLHEVIDHYLANAAGPDVSCALAALDPGRGADDSPITPLARALALTEGSAQTANVWHDSLRGRDVLVVGEFPPYILEDLLADGISLTQIHPPHEGTRTPPHFHHLTPLGLRGLSSLQELAGVRCDVMLVHGAVVGDEVRVSPLVPIVLRMFPEAERHLAADDQVAPHMLVSVPHAGFRRVALFL